MALRLHGMRWGPLITGLKSSEQGNRQFRRSLYFVKDLRAGDVITADAIRSVRPGFGLAPKYFDDVIGRKLATSVSYGTPVSRDSLAKPELN